MPSSSRLYSKLSEIIILLLLIIFRNFSAKEWHLAFIVRESKGQLISEKAMITFQTCKDNPSVKLEDRMEEFIQRINAMNITIENLEEKLEEMQKDKGRPKNEFS